MNMKYSILYKCDATDFETRFIHLFSNVLVLDDKLVNSGKAIRYNSNGYYELEFSSRKDFDEYVLTKPNFITETKRILDDPEVKEFIQLNNIHISLTVIEKTVQQTILSI